MATYGRVDNTNTIVEIIQTDLDITTMFSPALIWVQLDTVNPEPQIGWTALENNGVWTFITPVVVTQPLPTIIASLEAGVQAWLDTTAQGNGYADSVTCMTYLNSSNPTWAADAKAMLAWRDAVWTACFELEQSMMATPPNPLPTQSQIIAQLPQPAAFGWVSHVPGS